MRPGETGTGERGFAMVALLVAMSVTAIWMAAALPAWRQQAQRQREEDLIFRGEQYARAIVLFQDKNRGALPPSIDILVSQHYLRKKWKDPITNDDFVAIGTGMPATGSPTQQPATQTPGRTSQPPGVTLNPGRAGQPGTGQQLASPQQMGITGVRSKSNATSIKIYQNFQTYSQWPFDAAVYRAVRGRTLPRQQENPQQGRPGGPGGERGIGPGAPGRGVPGGAPVRGGGTGPAGPGAPPVPPGGRAGGS